MDRAIFIEKEGIIIKKRTEYDDLDMVEFCPDVITPLKIFQSLGFKTILISKQNDLVKSYHREIEIYYENQEILIALLSRGVDISGFYYCTHMWDFGVESGKIECLCNRPEQGLLLQAASDFKLNLQNSWNIRSDFSKAPTESLYGCKTVVVEDGKNETTDKDQSEFKVLDLREAAFLIASFENSLRKHYPNLSQTD